MIDRRCFFISTRQCSLSVYSRRKMCYTKKSRQRTESRNGPAGIVVSVTYGNCLSVLDKARTPPDSERSDTRNFFRKLSDILLLNRIIGEGAKRLPS